MIISALNPEVTDLEKSYLLNPYSAGVTTILVKNSDRFTTSSRIMIGEMGQEKTEVVSVSAVNADENTLTIGITAFAHSADDPVYVLRFDQVKFYRSTTTSTGTYTLLSTQDLDVDNANLETLYDDTAGTSAYFYKTTVYHSITTIESAFSDVIQGSGWRREQVGNIIDEILQEVGDLQETQVTRTELLGYFNDVNDDLQTNVARPYTFLHARTTLTQTANTSYINFPTDTNGRDTMWKFDYLDYNFRDSTTTPATDITYTLKVIPEPEFRNIYSDNTIDSTTVDDNISVVTLDTSVNRFRFDKPFETTDSILYLHYWKYFDVIDSEGDVIETPTPRIYKLYCKGKFYRKRAISDITLGNLADIYERDYQIEKSKYKQLDRKDQGSSRAFRPFTSRNSTYTRR